MRHGLGDAAARDTSTTAAVRQRRSSRGAVTLPARSSPRKKTSAVSRNAARIRAMAGGIPYRASCPFVEREDFDRPKQHRSCAAACGRAGGAGVATTMSAPRRQRVTLPAEETPARLPRPAGDWLAVGAERLVTWSASSRVGTRTRPRGARAPGCVLAAHERRSIIGRPKAAGLCRSPVCARASMSLPVRTTGIDCD